MLPRLLGADSGQACRSPPCHPLQHNVAKVGSAAVAAPAVWALVTAGAQLHAKDNDGDEPLHWAVQLNRDAEGAAAAAAALIAAGADANSLSGGEGEHPAALALRRKDAAACTTLLSVLLDGQQAGGSGSPGGSSREAAGSGGGMAAAALAGPATRMQAAEIVPAPSAPPLQESSSPPCPVCLEPGACFTGPCGHLVCEGCAQTALVRWAGGGLSLCACGARLFACGGRLDEQASSVPVGC